MRTSSAVARGSATESVRRPLRDTEENFGSILTDIARTLYPPPNTAAQIAAAIGCSVRNAEFCLAGKQDWSGDAVAVFVAEILKRHHMRNVRVMAK
jgi:hypothetical protein